MPEHRLNKEQARAVRDIDHNLCVVAGAGCGKTTVLVERYIHALAADRERKVANLAAITFTENAASQMRNRIRRECLGRIAAGDAMERQRWLRRKRDLDAAPVSTFHAFCGSILRRYAIEAGVDPRFTILDEVAGALMLADAVSGTIKDLIDADDADLVLLLRHHSLYSIRAMVTTLVGQSERFTSVVEGALKKPDEEIIKKISAEVLKAKREATEALLTDPECRSAVGILHSHQGREGDKLELRRADVLDAIARLRKTSSGRQLDEAVACLFSFDRRKVGSAKSWQSADVVETVRQACKTIVDLRDTYLKDVREVTVGDLEQEHLRLVRALASVARKAIGKYEDAKAAVGGLDYNDLQVRARDLLRDNPGIRRRLQATCHQLLVDELQDTNFLQLEIVDLLTKGPRGAARPGALFTVGDPKQSIYRFRGAEVEVFEETLSRLKAGGRVNLVESYRLHDAGAAFVNHVFSPLLGEMYTPVEGAGGRGALNPHGAEILLAEVGESSNAVARRDAEARLIAGRIEQIVGTLLVPDAATGEPRTARWGDVAILFRAATSLPLYEHALKDHAIPYHVVGGFGFYRQQEIRDVVNYLRVLDNPSDNLSLAGLLRSPFFAASDEGLYHLHSLGGRFWDGLGRAEAEGEFGDADRAALVRARDEIGRLMRLKDRLPLAELVDRIVFESGYASAVTGQFAGERRFANLRQLVELARHFDRAGALTMGDFIRYLDEFVKNELRQEQAPVEQAGGDVVQIMTVHKAKGLEFPIVVLPDTGAGTRGGRQQQMFINPLTGIAVKLKDDDEEASGGAKPAAYVLAKRKDDEANRAEHLRTFYVAATRAKEYLVLSANAEIDKTSWLAQLRTALPFEVAHGETEIEYGDGYRLRLFVARPGREVHRGPKRAGPRDIFADGRVRPDALRKPKSRPPKEFATVLENIKPPPAASPAVGAMAGTISVTALTDFEACPVLYRLRYELGMRDGGSDGGIFAAREDGMTAAEEGTVFHSVFEKIVADPGADIGEALERALGESETSPAPEAASQFANLVRGRVEAFRASALGRRVAAATARDAEAPFVMKMGEAVLSGVVDLVFEGEGGEVEIVDYKSDRVSAEDAKRRGGEYEMQLGIYAIAMSRHMGRPIGRASVYFIRPAVEVEIPTDRTALEGIEQRARGVIEGIASGDRRRVRACPAHCRCRQLCDRLMESRE